MPEYTYTLVDGTVEVTPSLEDFEEVFEGDALDESIRKWEFIVSCLKIGSEVDDCGQNNTCALCALGHGLMAAQ